MDYPGPMGFACFNSKGFGENIGRLKRGSLAVIDAEHGIRTENSFIRIARDDIGEERVADMTALGCFK